MAGGGAARRVHPVLVSLSLAGVGLVTLVPAIVLVAPTASRRLYALDLDAQATAVRVIVRHRAVFFGATGALLLASIALPAWRPPAILIATVTKLAFVVLAWREAPDDAALRRIAAVDVALLALLTAATLVAECSPS